MFVFAIAGVPEKDVIVGVTLGPGVVGACAHVRMNQGTNFAALVIVLQKSENAVRIFKIVFVIKL